MSGGFGTTAFGLGTFGIGGGVSTFQVTRAEAISLNAARVFFTESPKTFDASAANDALRPSNWTLSARNPPGAKVRLVQHVAEVAGNTLAVDVYFDGRLDSVALYRITADAGMESSGGALVDSTVRFADFFSLELPAAYRRHVRRGMRDIANPQLARDAPQPGGPLASYYATSAGSLAEDRGLVGLRKRVIRRVTTRPGGFLHLPDYGLAQDSKGLIRPDALRRLQIAAQQQVKREPEVRRARVVVRQSREAPGVVFMIIQVDTQEGESDEFSVSVNLAE